jgi:hypothetical protein
MYHPTSPGVIPVSIHTLGPSAGQQVVSHLLNNGQIIGVDKANLDGSFASNFLCRPAKKLFSSPRPAPDPKVIIPFYYSQGRIFNMKRQLLEGSL